MDANDNGFSYVQQRIVDALLELMAEVPYDRIAVTMITRRAQVARVSFYRNFDCKDDVLRRNAQRLTAGFQAGLDPDLREYDSRAYVAALLEHMRAQDPTVRLLMDAGRMDIIREEFDRAFAVGGVDRRDSARRRFLSGGLYNLFYKWALDGYDPSADQIAEFVCELVH